MPGKNSVPTIRTNFMITIDKQPIYKTEIFIHNGTYTTKDVWEDEIDLTAYPFSCTLRVDHVQQSVNFSTLWVELKPTGSEKIEVDIEKKMRDMYVKPE